MSKSGHDPDWEALNDINFLLYNRFAHPLNAALSAIELAEQPDLAGYSPQWWRDRAKSKIAATISLVMAWSWLIQYKNGMVIPKQAIRPFSLSETIYWLGYKLKIESRLTYEGADLLLRANQETFQEAILHLHNVASSQGSGVNIVWQREKEGVRFAVQFKRRRHKTPMPNLDELIKSFNAHWRSQLTAFELILARNFLEMNGLELEFKDTGQRGEFSFVVQVAMTTPITNGKASQLAVPNRAKSVFESDVPTHAEGQSATAQLSHADIVKRYNLSTDNATVLLETTPPAPLVEETTPLRQRRPENLPEWRSVIEYEDVDWASLGYVNRHTYHRLTNPLIKALGHLDTVRYSEDKNEADNSLNSAQQHLEIMITSMKAWATLTRWKNSGEISLDKLPLLPDEFPNWFTHYIQQKTTLELKHSLPLHVNHDAFFEGILLLVEISQYIGTPRMVQFRNAKNDKGVWVQIVFHPPHRRFYKSKLDVLDSFIRTNPMGEELAMQFAVADDLFKLHGTHFTLQENTKTGEQAFAILMPIAGERVPILAGGLVVSDESPLS